MSFYKIFMVVVVTTISSVSFGRSVPETLKSKTDRKIPLFNVVHNKKTNSLCVVAKEYIGEVLDNEGKVISACTSSEEISLANSIDPDGVDVAAGTYAAAFLGGCATGLIYSYLGSVAGAIISADNKLNIGISEDPTPVQIGSLLGASIAIVTIGHSAVAVAGATTCGMANFSLYAYFGFEMTAVPPHE